MNNKNDLILISKIFDLMLILITQEGTADCKLKSDLFNACAAIHTEFSTTTLREKDEQWK